MKCCWLSEKNVSADILLTKRQVTIIMLVVGPVREAIKEETNVLKNFE